MRLQIAGSIVRIGLRAFFPFINFLLLLSSPPSPLTIAITPFRRRVFSRGGFLFIFQVFLLFLFLSLWIQVGITSIRWQRGLPTAVTAATAAWLVVRSRGVSQSVSQSGSGRSVGGEV